MEYTNETKVAQGGFLSFDPIVVIRDVMKNWLTIVMIAVAVGVGAYIVTDMQYEPRYQSQATFVVTSRSSASTVYSNLSSTTEMATVFSELINSSVMKKNILEEMGTSYFDGTISASVVPETNLLNMTVTASDPRTAFRVAQTIIDHHEEVTYRVVEGVSLEILQGAMVPTAPINRPDAVGQMKKMGVLAGLAACAVFAWLSLSRDTIRSGTEARKKLDCDYLGDVPHENKYKTIFARIRRKKAGILVTNPVTSFRFVESMRKLARRVEQHMGDGKVLMVSSVLENEGKSTVAVNLALSMAQKNKKVLLIDCDLRKPACHTLLEQKLTGAGLRDVLVGKAELGDALLRYKRTNMYMLLEKRSDVNSGDLLSSATMRSLLKWARKEFDLIVLDLPPMSVVSDSETVANLADASVLVVRQNGIRVPGINKAVAALEGGSAKMLGCVLNDVHSTFLSSGQGYRYGGYGRYSHYGSYGSYGEKASRK
ncbi:MAG: polysaccharide biosynthesis tyrosine autokinase [Ruminococcaceae bacterium]|nr:polysaccharide biosynthesis tyrosine autokinase [Oscillospiraceae bacterium]